MWNGFVREINTVGMSRESGKVSTLLNPPAISCLEKNISVMMKGLKTITALQSPDLVYIYNCETKFNCTRNQVCYMTLFTVSWGPGNKRFLCLHLTATK